MGLVVDVVKNTERDYLWYFHHKRIRGKYVGKKNGFPLSGMCDINKLKVNPINKYLKQFKDLEIIQYIGIAADEPKRLARLQDNCISLLDKYGYTEEMAEEKAKEYGLLSPIYELTNRTGCWFCPNTRLKDFYLFRQHYPELWNELLELGKDNETCTRNFKYQITIEEMDQKLNKYEADNFKQ